MLLTLPTFLLIFSLAFNVFCTLGMVYFSWKIFNMEVTPPYTWSLKFWACLIQLVQIGLSAFFINDIANFIATYPPDTLVFSYAMGALRSGLLFTFVYQVHHTLTSKFPS